MRVEKNKNDMFLSEYPSPSLFRKHSLGTFLSLLLLSACSPDNDALPGDDGGNTPSAALRIEVSASDFTSAATRGDAGSNNIGNNAATRATDNGASTTFENGDRIGIIVLDGSGRVLSDNIPYIYNGSAWNFDNSNTEGKTAVYYDNKATNYVAYFPYSPEADGIAGAGTANGSIANADITDALKAKFPPRYDQRTEDAYRASDLLVWSSETGSTPLKKLKIVLTHAYASLSMSPSVTCTINGTETSYIPSSVSDASFTIGTEPLLPYRADDGSYRIIVSPQTTGARWFFGYEATMHSGTMTSTALAANNRYTLALTLDLGDYTLDKAQVGDFYCRSSDGNTGYLIPGDIPSLTDAQKAACLGVVLKAGRGTDEGYTGKDDKDAENWMDDCDYKLKDGTTTMSDIHGYVLALHDANGGKRCLWDRYYWINRVNTDQKRYTGFYGYKNTQTIKQYAAANSYDLKDWFPATYYTTAAYEESYASPANSSGWFFPSAGQCWYWHKNEGVLLPSIKKASGNENYSWKPFYYSSSEHNEEPGGKAWCLYIGDDISWGYKDGDVRLSDYVRACLAF